MASPLELYRVLLHLATLSFPRRPHLNLGRNLECDSSLRHYFVLFIEQVPRERTCRNAAYRNSAVLDR